MKKLFLLLIILIFSTSLPVIASEKGSMMEEKGSAKMAAAQTYNIDVSHSTLGFAVKHLGVGITRGAFDVYEGTVSYDPKSKSFSADVTIVVSSIDTNNEGRDNHLKSADFFDAENHPQITFTNAKIKEIDGKTIIFGDLTIKGKTKTITIPAEINGPVQGMGGKSVIGIAGSTTINRQDFGVNWNKTLDSGGLAVDNNVTLVVEIEAQAS